MKQRKFTFNDQLAFAKLSGDYNPMHIDSLAARRFIFGRPVVHGIHILLWSLDNWLEEKTEPLAINSIKVIFGTAIGVDDIVNYSIIHEDGNHADIELTTENGAKAAEIHMDWGHSKQENEEIFSNAYPERGECRMHKADELGDASGSLDLYLSSKSTASLFPNLVRKLPLNQLAEILVTTRLVGMECPGLYSIYSALDLTFSAWTTDSGTLTYSATTYRPRFSSLEMKIEAPGMKGTLKSFIRPAPQKQASFIDLQKHVKDGEFEEQSAFIIGGSRGLGEITAKLLTAGKARVSLSYYRGSQDAQRIVEEINAAGGSAVSLPFNVLDPPKNFTEIFNEHNKPTHLYYFATPYIAMGTRGAFSPQLFQKFCDYYVNGFVNTIQTMLSHDAPIQKIFYPSTVFIDTLPINMGEYASAKMAAETCCSFLQKSKPSIKIYNPRLPMMDTDQTASLLPTASQDPLSVMLEHLRYFNDI